MVDHDFDFAPGFDSLSYFVLISSLFFVFAVLLVDFIDFAFSIDLLILLLFERSRGLELVQSTPQENFLL